MMHDDYPCHDMDAIMDVADTRIIERPNINGLRGIDPPGINQMLDAIEVDNLQIEGMRVEGTTFGLAEVVGCLAAFEGPRDAVAGARFLTAVSAAACATTRADTTPNALFLETIKINRSREGRSTFLVEPLAGFKFDRVMTGDTDEANRLGARHE